MTWWGAESDTPQLAAGSGVSTGAHIKSPINIITDHLFTVLKPYLVNTVEQYVVGQGSAPHLIVMSSYGDCEIPENDEIPVIIGYDTAATVDDFGIAIDGGPNAADLTRTLATGPGNNINIGRVKTDGHLPYTSDVRVGQGTKKTEYGVDSYTDPKTGQTYPGKKKPDKKVKKPKIEVHVGAGLTFGADAGTDPNTGSPVVVHADMTKGLTFVNDPADATSTALAVKVDNVQVFFNDKGEITTDPTTSKVKPKNGGTTSALGEGHGIHISPGPPPRSAPVLTPSTTAGIPADTNLEYAYAYVTADGDTGLAPSAIIATDSTHGSVHLAIAAAPAGTTGTGFRIVRRGTTATTVATSHDAPLDPVTGQPLTNVTAANGDVPAHWVDSTGGFWNLLPGANQGPFQTWYDDSGTGTGTTTPTDMQRAPLDPVTGAPMTNVTAANGDVPAHWVDSNGDFWNLGPGADAGPFNAWYVSSGTGADTAPATGSYTAPLDPATGLPMNNVTAANGDVPAHWVDSTGGFWNIAPGDGAGPFQVWYATTGVGSPDGTPPSASATTGAWQVVTTVTADVTTPITYTDSAPTLTGSYTEATSKINVKPAAYITAPYTASVAIPGTRPPLYPHSGVKFSSADPAVSNDGLEVNAKYGITIDAENYLDILFAGTVTVRRGWGSQLQTMKGYSAQQHNASGWKYGGDSGFGVRLNLAAYQTPPSGPVYAPILTDAVTYLQEPETSSTKKLVSGLRMDGGDDHSGQMIDIAVNHLGLPLGLALGQGVDGNGIAALVGRGLQYNNITGAIETLLGSDCADCLTLPPPTTTTTPPTTAPPGTPPGTTCTDSTSVDGTVTTTCTTVTGGTPGTGDQAPPPDTIPNPGSGGGSAGTPGTDCVLGAVMPLPLGTITNVSGGGNLIGPDGFSLNSNTFEDLRMHVNTAVPFAGIWLQVHVNLGPTYPYYSWRFGLDTEFAPNFLYNIIGFGINNNAGNGARSWSLINGNAVYTPCTSNPTDAYLGFWVTCDRYLRCYLGESADDLTFQGEIPYRFVGDIAHWEFTADGTNLHPGGGAEQRFLTVDQCLAYTGQPAGVTLRNRDGSILYAGDGTTIPNPYPGDTPGLPGTQTTTTTTQPPLKLNGNLDINGTLFSTGQSLNGIAVAGVIAKTDINAAFAQYGDAFDEIVDPNTGIGYVSPVAMIPTGAPGMSGGMFWPGA